MKNIKFISAIALTMMMASCDDFDLPNPPVQSNPEPEAVFENSGLVLTQGDANVNLVTFNNADQAVTVANITDLVNFPADYTLDIVMEVSGDQNFSKVAKVPTTIVDNAVMVQPDEFNAGIQEAMTKKPGTYDVYSRFVAYAVLGDTRARLGGLTASYCPSKFLVTTLDPAKVIEDNYYLVPCDAQGNPVFAAALKMNNTAGNVSPYDNPEFALKIDVTEDEVNGLGYLWKVAPESAYLTQDASQCMGCSVSPTSDLAGKLGVDYAAGSIKLLGSVLVSVNVEVDSYSVNYAFEALYPFSGRTAANKLMLLYTDNYITYTGVTAINQAWILAAQADKTNGVFFKQDANVAPEVTEDGLNQTGLLTTSSDGDGLTAPVAANCLYWVNVNLVQLTYELYALKTLSVIGSGNDWKLDTATQLTPSSDFKVWTADNVPVGDEFKINANGAWTIGFSGKSVPDATGKQVYTVDKQDGGENLHATPGTYKVTVDFSTKPYTVTLE